LFARARDAGEPPALPLGCLRAARGIELAGWERGRLARISRDALTVAASVPDRYGAGSMDAVLHALGIALLLLACLAALFTLVLGLPGTLLIVGFALLYAWATDFVLIQWSTIGWLALLAVMAEGLEFLASGAGAAGARPSRRVTIGALGGAFVGGIVGAPFFFGVGALLGALAGAFGGAALAVRSEGGSLDDSVTTGLAAMRGRLLGFVVKSAIAVVMVGIVAAAVW
jgi:hypothetical protein